MKEKEMSKTSRFFTANSIIIGTCIGAGVLGIPYVASKAGFFAALIYIILVGLIMMLINLYLGEISLRTIGDHQIPGYAKKYLNKTGRRLADFAMIFGIYSALVAYMLGMGESLSFILFGNLTYTLIAGLLVGLGMSWLLWGGIDTLKKYENLGVGLILLLIVFIFFVFVRKIVPSNLMTFDVSSIFLPFGVILFAMMSFQAIPEVRLILHKNEKMMKPVIISSLMAIIILYSIFTLVVVGSQGSDTPGVATLALGGTFILLGFFTMFTSYLALGNALSGNFVFDNRFGKKRAWFFSSIVPIFIFVIIKTFPYFSFTTILGWGGVISAGLMGILITIMSKNAKKKGDRRPEYKIPVGWFIIILFGMIFSLGILAELGVF